MRHAARSWASCSAMTPVTTSWPTAKSSSAIGGRFTCGRSWTASSAASMPIPGEATFRYPDGPRGYYKHGFRMLNDGTADWLHGWGVQLNVKLPAAGEVELTVSIAPAPHGDTLEPRTSTVCIAGE